MLQAGAARGPSSSAGAFTPAASCQTLGGGAGAAKKPSQQNVRVCRVFRVKTTSNANLLRALRRRC